MNKLKNILYVASILCLLSIAFLAGSASYLLLTSKPRIDAILLQTKEIAVNTEIATANLATFSGEVAVAGQRFNGNVNDDFYKELNKYSRNQAASVLQNTDNSRKIQNHLIDMIDLYKEKGGIFFNEMGNVAKNSALLIEHKDNEIKYLIEAATGQLNQNGDKLTNILTHLDEGLVVDQQSLSAILKELAGTSHNIKIITEDKDIADLIHNINLNAANIEVITRSGAKLASDVAFPPPAKGFKKYVLNPLLYSLKVINGAGNILLLINKF